MTASSATAPAEALRPAPGVLLRRQMFSRLVERIRRHHVFSSVWSEADWSKDLPVIEREVLEAADREGVLLGLRHLSNSLRDGHLSITTPEVDERALITLPIELSNVGTRDRPEEYTRRARSGERWWVRPFDCGREPCASQPAARPVNSSPDRAPARAGMPERLRHVRRDLEPRTARP